RADPADGISASSEVRIRFDKDVVVKGRRIEANVIVDIGRIVLGIPTPGYVAGVVSCVDMGIEDAGADCPGPLDFEEKIHVSICRSKQVVFAVVQIPLDEGRAIESPFGL